MDDKYRHAVDKIKQSGVRFRIVKLLKENPYVMDNLHGLSLWAAVAESLVSPELEQLVSLGVLHRYALGPAAIYRYTPEEAMRTYIEQHWAEIEQAIADLRGADRQSEGV